MGANTSPDCVHSRAGGALSLDACAVWPGVGPESIAGARSWPPVGTRFAILDFLHRLLLKLTGRAGASWG